MSAVAAGLISDPLLTPWEWSNLTRFFQLTGTAPTWRDPDTAGTAPGFLTKGR